MPRFIVYIHTAKTEAFVVEAADGELAEAAAKQRYYNGDDGGLPIDVKITSIDVDQS